MADDVEQAAINTLNGNAWWSNNGQDTRQQGHQGLMNRYDAQKKAGLMFQCKTEPVERKGHVVEGSYHVIRTDTDAEIGMVGKVFKPIQNDTLFDILEDVVKDSEAVYESAGSLAGGRRVWALAKLPNEYFVRPGDALRTYLLFALGHDGSLSLTMACTDIRVVCRNTENLALKTAKKDEYSYMQVVRNTTNSNQYIAQAKKMMGLAVKSSNIFSQVADVLASTPISHKYLENFVQVLFPSQADKDGKQPRANVEAQRDYIRNAFTAPINNIGQSNTAWSLYQAVTQFVDHASPARKNSPERLDFSWFGQGVQLRNTAFNWLMDYPVAGRELVPVPVMAQSASPWDQLTI